MTDKDDNSADVLARLYATILARKDADPKSSHTAQLLSRGTPHVARKMGEEAIETLVEGVRGDAHALTLESADLLYHLMVLWAALGVKPEDVYAELARREGTSGIAEKAARAEDK